MMFNKTFIVGIQLFDLPLKVIFSASSSFDIIFAFNCFVHQVIVTSLKILLHFLLQLGSSLSFFNLFRKLYTLAQAGLRIKLKSRNHRWHIVPLICFELEWLIDEGVFDFLAFPLFEESFYRFIPLLHHTHFCFCNKLIN